jgi:hypothetical protein
MIKASPTREQDNTMRTMSGALTLPTLAVVAIRTEGAMAVGGVETLHLVIGNHRCVSCEMWDKAAPDCIMAAVKVQDQSPSTR